MRSLADIRENLEHVGCDNDTAREMCDEIERLRELLEESLRIIPDGGSFEFEFRQKVEAALNQQQEEAETEHEKDRAEALDSIGWFGRR